MDSANSGSMQSSSGGDEEYDSSSHNHPHDHSFLLNPQTNHLLNSNPSTFLFANDHPYNNHNTILHPFSHSTSSTNSSLYNNSNNNIQDFWSTNPQNDQTIQTSYTPSQQQQPSNQSINLDRPLSKPDHHQQTSSVVAKNPKKRTRASRRAPTTVLTTDTTNFRQMVQEFTGIPAAPFSTATSAFSRRLDLFGAAARSGGESLIYPLRPSPQKLPSSSNLYNMGDHSTSLASIITSTSNIVNATSYQKSQQNVLNMQGNTMFSYQSMLQSQHQEVNNSQESSRNMPINLDDQVEHFRSFNAPNAQLDQDKNGSY